MTLQQFNRALQIVCKASLPALTQTIIDAKDVQGVGDAIRSAWIGYGDGKGVMADNVYKFTIGPDRKGQGQINIFKNAMRYLHYSVTDQPDGTTIYRLQKSQFAIATKVDGNNIHMVVWDPRGGQARRSSKMSVQQPVEIMKHLLGQHDQQSHAGGRGSATGTVSVDDAHDAIKQAMQDSKGKMLHDPVPSITYSGDVVPFDGGVDMDKQQLETLARRASGGKDRAYLDATYDPDTDAMVIGTGSATPMHIAEILWDKAGLQKPASLGVGPIGKTQNTVSADFSMRVATARLDVRLSGAGVIVERVGVIWSGATTNANSTVRRKLADLGYPPQHTITGPIGPGSRESNRRSFGDPRKLQH